jgi:hypothetical protein
MASPSSKALPYIAVGVGLLIAIFAIAGYGSQVDAAVGLLQYILPIVAGGGLINKAFDASVEKSKALRDNEHLKTLMREVIAEKRP